MELGWIRVQQTCFWNRSESDLYARTVLVLVLPRYSPFLPASHKLLLCLLHGDFDDRVEVLGDYDELSQGISE
jgi:hypothetical protein